MMNGTSSTSRPDFSNSETSGKTLLVGFAYSLMPDGSPGSYNQKIAKSMKEDMVMVNRKPEGEGPWVGMQWEIFDALEEEWQGRL